MNDLSEPVIINRDDGTELRFAKLSPRSMLRFRDSFRFFRKRCLYQNLALAGITGEATIGHLNKFDTKPLLHGEAVMWINDIEGQRTAVLLSMQQANAKATEEDMDALGIPVSKWLEAGAGVIGAVLVPGGKQDDGPKDGAIETGSPTPASSEPSVEPVTTPSTGQSTSSTAPSESATES